MSTLTFDVFWRDRGAAKGLQGIGKDAQASGKHVSDLSSHGKQLAAGFAGFAAVRIFDSFISGARESNMISRVTEQRIQSTGGAAHVTAGQVGDLATAISNKTGADDEAIQSGENMLLTFTGVRNEVGKGNDVFNQAAAAATDLAAGLNQGQVTAEGTQQAAVLLGKALNDPIAGMTALRRVGISFTASQVSQIKALQQSGHTLEAQKVILAEVNKEFGGTARAAADPLQRMSVILGNVGEDIGNKLLPALNEGADLLAAIPEPVYLVGAAFVTLGAGAIGVAKGINAVRDIAQGTTGLMRVLGLRTAEAAAAEVTQAAAADASAASTAAAGDAAAVAGKKFGALAGKLGLAGAVVGLGAVSVEVSEWAGNVTSAKVSTDDLTQSLTELGRTGKISGAALNTFQQGWGPFSQDVHTSGEAMQTFGELAKGALGGAGESWLDFIGRMQEGSDRMGRLKSITEQYDASLTRMVRGGSVVEARNVFDQLSRSAQQQGVSFDEIRKLFPQYTAAIGQVEAATDAAARKIGDENSVMLKTQHGGNIATAALRAVAGATDNAAAAAYRHVSATQKELAAMDANADRVLNLRSADRDLAQARDDLTQAVKDNGRTLDVNTAKGRANGDALDRVTRATREDLKAHRDAGEPMRQYAARVAASRDRLIEEAHRAGLSTTAAGKYADAILAVPRRQVVDYQARGLAAARAGARGLAADIAHINGRVVTVKYQADGRVLIQARGTTAIARAGGGRIPGWSPSKTADNVPVAATAGEHMWSVDEVKGAGGHGAVEQMRAAARAGALRLAAGGAVNRRVATNYVGSFPQGVMTDFIDRWAAGWTAGGGGGGGGPVPGGSGVARWGPMVHRALGARGLPQSLWDNWMRQIATESGGNPNAVQGNIGDVNNRSGDLAKGLLQVIGATFRAFHVPGTSNNVFDAWANMNAAMNYAAHRYPNMESVIGHGHGYARGTRHASPGWHWIGEDGPELVRFRGGEQVATAAQSAVRAAAGGGASKVTVNVTMNLDPSAHAFEDKVVGAINRAVRTARLSRVVLPGVRQ